jgi:putative endonuclease
MNWQVYILQCSDGSLYTGITNNLELRVKTHNSGRGAKYTKNRLPVRLVYKEYTKDKSQSLRRELEIKKLSRLAKKELINSINLSAS